MAELTVLESKLGEVTGLAMAAQGATEGGVWYLGNGMIIMRRWHSVRPARRRVLG